MLRLVLVCIIAGCGAWPLRLTGGPVRDHGALRVEGAVIVGEHGGPVALAGVSLSSSQWQGRFYNGRAIDWLKRDWNIGVVRASLGVAPEGYLKRPAREARKIRRVVEACLDQDVYVIINWNDHHAEHHVEKAVQFFGEMARAYGDRPNVIYEIYSEPLAVSWSKVVKPYAERVIAAIRAVDPDNLIIVGTPSWCQRADLAARDRLSDPNVAYALHFHASTHKDELRDRVEAALDEGLPLFVTEWGPCSANGRGAIDEESTREWLTFMKARNLSHCVWAVSDKRDAASIVVPGASSRGGWRDAELTASGRLVRSWIRSW